MLWHPRVHEEGWCVLARCALRCQEDGGACEGGLPMARGWRASWYRSRSRARQRHWACQSRGGGEVIPPSVRHSTYTDPSEVPYEDMLDKTPVPEVIRAVEILKEETPDVLLFPKITGTVTLAAHLRGVDRLVRDTLRAPETLTQWLEVAGKAARLFCTAVAEAGADVITISDPTSSPIPSCQSSIFAMPVG